jgi:hypothetical protein
MNNNLNIFFVILSNGPQKIDHYIFCDPIKRRPLDFYLEDHYSFFTFFLPAGTSKEIVMKSYQQNLMDSINAAKTIQKAAIQVFNRTKTIKICQANDFYVII